MKNKEYQSIVKKDIPQLKIDLQKIIDNEEK